jgi:hypothetical protein
MSRAPGQDARALMGTVSDFASSDRQSRIQEILGDLKRLLSNPEYRKQAALNLEFFRATRSRASYFWWLVSRTPWLRRHRADVVELADLPFPHWQNTLLSELSWFEARVPQMLRPIKKMIIQEVTRLAASQNDPIVLLSIGCGGMELERQVIMQLLRRRFKAPVAFVGVDYSTAVAEVIASRFRPLSDKGLVEVKCVSSLGAEAIRDLRARPGVRKFSLVFLNAMAEELGGLPRDSFNLVYHTRLRHHISAAEAADLEGMASRLAPKVIEFDDLYNPIQVLLTSIFAWRLPVVLNGSVLSYFRDFSQREVASEPGKGGQVRFFGLPVRSYIRFWERPAGAR